LCLGAAQGKCIDLGRITGGGGKKLERKINESGYMRVSSANAAEWTRNDDANLLRHDAPLLLTTPRGGGTYEFSITLAPNTQLDKDHLVFGKLLEVREWRRWAVAPRVYQYYYIRALLGLDLIAAG
jgi:cyclophilin family peptidyl-prolyl cis-trans isomerase